VVYEFRCRQCSSLFEVHATLREKEQGLSPECPQCGSGDVGRVFSPVLFLRTGSGSGTGNGAGLTGSFGAGGGSSGGCCCGGACSCAH